MIIPAIVEQHAEEAAFLWCLRDAATDQPHYTLRHLKNLEERIEAHVDGLRVAGEGSLEIMRAQLQQYRGPGELFAAAVLVLESRNETHIAQILQFAESLPESRRGLLGALGWVSPDVLRGPVVTWLGSSFAFQRLVGLIACSLHRADLGSRMEHLLADEPSVRARALRLAGELGRVDLRQRVCLALEDEDEGCRFWAAWSAGLLGERAAAIPVLQAYALADGRFKWRALDLVVRLMDPEAAIGWLRELGRNPSNARLLAVAVGIRGDPIVVPWLIQKMSVPPLARVAGESFSLITGADLSDHGLDGSAPEGFTIGPTDDPGDSIVAIDPDENLLWADAAKVRAWWDKQGKRFAHGVRHLKGLPLTQESCHAVLRDGYQRQRRAAAYEMALIASGTRLWNWRARSSAQENSLRTATKA